MRRRCMAVLFIIFLAATMCPAIAAPTHTVQIPVTVGSAEPCKVLLVAQSPKCPMPKGSVDGVYTLTVTGSGSFPSITFDKMGVFSYTIYQEKGTTALEYDNTVYQLTVYITRGTNGTNMEVVLTKSNGADKLDVCSFSNLYPVAVEHNPPVRKVVTGDTPPSAAVFQFTMTAVSNTAGLTAMPMPEGAVNGVKTMSAKAGVEKEFGTMKFEAPGQYVYRIAEVNDGQEGFTYDEGVYTLTYTVTKKGNEMTCDLSVTKNGKNVDEAVFVFTNPYKGKEAPTAKPTATASAKPSSSSSASPSASPSPTPTPKPTDGGGSGGGGGGGGGGGATPKPKIGIEGTKIWNDGNNAHGVRPSSITIHLFANGVEVDAEPTWTKNGNVWHFSYGKLPETDDSGQTISYTVTEDGVNYYTATVDGMTVTNTIEDREPSGYTDISGTKIWRDDGSGRPTSITVRLYRDGVEID